MSDPKPQTTPEPASNADILKAYADGMAARRANVGLDGRPALSPEENRAWMDGWWRQAKEDEAQ